MGSLSNLADEPKAVGKTRCICRACGEEFELEKGLEFALGETICPACGISSEVRLAGEECSNSTGIVERQKTLFWYCDRCKGEWLKTVDGKEQDAHCPHCRTTTTETREREV